MSDVVRRSLCALMGEHGQKLLVQPDLCERLLRQAAPEGDEEIRLVTAALRDGVPTRLRHVLDADAVPREADAFAGRAGLPPDVARKVVETWAAALRQADPLIDLGETKSAAPAAAESFGETLARAWLGLRTGAGAGLLTVAAVLLLAGAALAAAPADAAKRLPFDPVGWALLGLVAGSAIGVAAAVTRVTCRPELLGAMAGAAAGLLGGVLHAPLAAALPGADDPELRRTCGAVLGIFVCLIVGGVLGVFQGVILRTLWRLAVYRQRSTTEVLLGWRRWNDEGLFSEEQREWDRRAGL